MLVHDERILEFGADTVGPCHQNRLFHAVSGNRVKTAERPEVAQNVLIERRFGMLFDQLDSLISSRNVYAGVFIIHVYLL